MFGCCLNRSLLLKTLLFQKKGQITAETVGLSLTLKKVESDHKIQNLEAKKSGLSFVIKKP